MKLTLRKALSIEPFYRSTVIAGENGLDNIVTSVIVMEAPDINNYGNEGDLLFTSLKCSFDLLSKGNKYLFLNNKG